METQSVPEPVYDAYEFHASGPRDTSLSQLDYQIEMNELIGVLGYWASCAHSNSFQCHPQSPWPSSEYQGQANGADDDDDTYSMTETLPVQVTPMDWGRVYAEHLEHVPTRRLKRKRLIMSQEAVHDLIWGPTSRSIPTRKAIASIFVWQLLTGT